jgi:SAM-dependent methyltransferase
LFLSAAVEAIEISGLADNRGVKTFLHVGCGQGKKTNTTRSLSGPEWQELRLDIDEAVHPDIVGTITDMNAVKSGSVDAVFSSHNIEHLYPHEVPRALAEFLRVLKPDGFAVITCPDLQSVAALIAEDRLTDVAYPSAAGPITPLDILYGHRPAMAAGNLFMAHHCGFTEKVLNATLLGCGFGSVGSCRRGAPAFDLWAVASKSPIAESDLRKLAGAHFPAC